MAGILIAGGSGFVGSHVTTRLYSEGFDVTVLDLAPSPDATDGFEFVQGDVFDQRTLDSVVEDKETVIDLVGLADISVCQKDPQRSFRLNVDSLSRILEAARKGGVHTVIFPSSAAVYGKVETVPIDETAIPNPSTVYGWHKWMAELNLRAFRQSYGVRYIVLRLFNVVGPGNSGVIHHYVKTALAGEPLRGFGRDQLRDFVHAEDVSDAFLLAATQSDVINKVINIGTGEGVRIAEIAAMVRECVPGTTAEFEEKSGYIPYHSVADIALARKLLGFDPVPARLVVRRMIQEMVSHDR